MNCTRRWEEAWVKRLYSEKRVTGFIKCTNEARYSSMSHFYVGCMSVSAGIGRCWLIKGSRSCKHACNDLPFLDGFVYRSSTLVVVSSFVYKILSASSSDLHRLLGGKKVSRVAKVILVGTEMKPNLEIPFPCGLYKVGYHRH
jgi:hypothetical protein